MPNNKHITVDQTIEVLGDLQTKADARFLKVADVDEYSLAAAVTPDTGMVATYQLTKNGAAVGDKINIPKDFLVKSVTLEVCQTADVPVAGYVPGDKYIDFVINTKEGDGQATHLYLLVNDLVDVYTGGNGIDITSGVVSVTATDGIQVGASGVGIKIDSTNANGLAVTSAGLKIGVASSSGAGALSASDWSTFNGKQDVVSGGNGIDVTSDVISAVVDSSNANGLSVGASGLAMGTASASATGALSSTDFSTFAGKQDALAAGTGIDATSFAAGTVAVDGDITAYTGTGAVDVTNHVISVGAATQSAAGTMSAADKTKLDGFEEATATDIAAIKATIWPSA